MPFGTRYDVYGEGYEWLPHSMYPSEVKAGADRKVIGAAQCSQPYDASIFNISAMSFGAISAQAVKALSGGAADGNFYHNTGEGGVSKFHIEGGGDLVYNVGTGYFGCRDNQGKFSPERFAETASLPNVKMIEIKLSQGAKPGHGGILPGSKVTAEIAQARGVNPGVECVSPPAHSAFSSPAGLVAFADQLRELSGGKPVGIKMCVGHREDVARIVKAMVSAGSGPDFITVDGGEGGTGAAPPEFSNRLGTPLVEALTLVDDLLRGAGIRERVTVISSGKVHSGFQLIRNFSLGADVCNAARAFMFSLGCIQVRVNRQSVRLSRQSAWMCQSQPHPLACMHVPEAHAQHFCNLNLGRLHPIRSQLSPGCSPSSPSCSPHHHATISSASHVYTTLVNLGAQVQHKSLPDWCCNTRSWPPAGTGGG
ncbi:unnamed protein product [Chrysoparadoxa australica]